tara:strand:+ start:7274 stop:7882 length:609 start_codon:yes stop_codon:yes gene_type:complete
MSKKNLRFKRLLSKYRSVSSELQSTCEIVDEMQEYFTECVNDYCDRSNIDLEDLKKDKEGRIEQLVEASNTTVKGVEEKIQEQEYDSKSLFRQIAKKFHPDALDPEDPDKDEKEEIFKIAMRAIDECNWGTLFDIAAKHDLEFKDYDSIISSLKLDIEREEAILKKKQNTWSWLLFNCEDDQACKDQTVLGFLKQVYSYENT